MKMQSYSRAFLGGVALFALGAAAPASRKPEIGTYGFDTAGMDTSVKPGDDFSRYASGKYLDALQIPADRATYGMFTKLAVLSQQRTHDILEAAAKNPGTDPEQQKVAAYYSTLMDEAAIEAKGAAPLKPWLAAIDQISDTSQLSHALGLANRYGVSSPFNAGVQQDLKDPSRMAVYLGQGGLGMPDRDYYLDGSNPKYVETAAKYRANIAAMLTLAGVPDAEAKAQAIYDLEKKIAQAHITRVERRQVEKRYNPYAATDLDSAFPGVDWAAYRKAAGISGESRVIVAMPTAFAGMAKLVQSEPLSSWKAYLDYHMIRRAAPVLSKAFVDQNFAFYGTTLSGTPQLQERWKRASDMTEGALGEAVGKLYVARYFPPESKAKADALVKNIIASMDNRLANLTWMDPKTKEAARAKLAVFTPKIGYPSKWRDYSALEVKQGDALGNMLRAEEFEYQRDLDKLGKPIDRSEWGMTPMTVNAYANPVWNEIVFPAAILQPPFFNPDADDAVNYGAIGAVIGHEIGHGFDDQGSEFDETGRIRNWWSSASKAAFKEKTARLGAQYDSYEPLPGAHISGQLTMGENIGDLGGIQMAYAAYHHYLDETSGGKAPVIGGLTGDQRFFLAWAQVWRGKYREDEARRRLEIDPHSPPSWRINGVVRNVDAWYDAFGIKEGDKLYLAPEDRVRIW